MGDQQNRQGQETQNDGVQIGAEKMAANPSLGTLGLPSFMFISSFAHSLDAKSRMVIPAVYREGLGKGFVIAPSLDFESIGIYPKEVWDYELAKLFRKASKNISFGGRALEMFSTYSYSDNEVDSQGRVLLPARIKQRYLGDAKEVVVSGRINHVLIKAQDKAGAQEDQFMLDKAELLRQLDLIDDE